MDKGRAYKLKCYDDVLATFAFEPTMTGHRARGLEVEPSLAHLLPLNLRQAPSDAELARFVVSRRIPKGRVYLEEVLRPFGLAPNDTKGIIDLSRGTSVNDAYSIVPLDDDIPYGDYNLFENDFDEVLQVIAYTGVIPQAALGNGRPSDLTTSGTFPKTWRKIDGTLSLFKAGSVIAAPNYGKEPYSEQLAWQVARAGVFDAVAYRLESWQGRICSICELFNSPDIAFVPFELCLPLGVLQLVDFGLALDYFQDIGDVAIQKFKSMAVFDSLIMNTDRHVGNFGVLRDNRTGAVLDAAPIFDNNVSLFTRDLDGNLSLPAMLARLAGAPGILDASLGWQGAAMLGELQRDQVSRLVDFEFEPGGFTERYRAANPRAEDVLTQNRLDLLGAFVRTRARELVGKT